MRQKKENQDKKVKFTISIDPIIFRKMESEKIKKSRIIEKLLKEYYGNKKMD